MPDIVGVIPKVGISQKGVGRMDIVFLVGRIIFGVYFAFNGVMHLTQLKSMVPYAQSQGVPAPRLMVIVSGLLILLGGLSVAVGVYPRIGALLIIIFLIPVTFMMHRFWAEKDPMAQQMQMTQFTKNMGLLGAAIMMTAITEWPLIVID